GAGGGAEGGEMQGEAVGGMADDLEERSADLAAAIRELDDVAHDLSVLAAGERRIFSVPEFRRRCGARDYRVVPGEARDRFRQLLQPAVVREAPVENSRVVLVRNLQSAAARRSLYGS